MDQYHSCSLNSGQGHDIVMLEEDVNSGQLNGKPLEIDEACYSLDEPEQDEAKALLTYDSLLSGHDTAKMSSHQLQGSETSENVIYRRNETATESGESPLIPRGVFQAMPSDELHEILSLRSDENHENGGERVPSIIPDFERLLSGDLVPENAGDLQKRCQELIQAGHESEKILDELKMFLGHGSAYLDHDEEGSADVASDGLDEDTSWKEEDCREIVEMMRIGSQCNDPNCRITKCQLGQRMIADIEADLENVDMLLPLVSRRLLDSIIIHCSLCDDPLCCIPWCSFFTQFSDLPLEDQRAALQGRYRKRQFTKDFEEISIDISTSSEFIQLESDILWPCVQHAQLQRGTRIHSVPGNGIDFLVNGHFGKYGQLGFTALSTTLPPIRLNIIQCVSWESSSALWKSLKDLRHENFVRHLWSCVDANSVTICRDHYCTDTESLESLIDKVKPRKIDATFGLTLVAGLVSAVKYLNEHGIYYLKWTASGIQMNWNYTLAQLCDFSLAVTASTLEEDEEMIDVIANSLSPQILPPEIFSGAESEGSLGSFTDVWGIGCIMYHLSCGQPVHYDLRHNPLESVRETVENFLPGEHLKSVNPGDGKKILTKIFTAKESRIDVLRLARLLRATLLKPTR